MNLDTVKQQLEQRLSQLMERSGKVNRDLSQPHSADWAEQAQERENDEVLESIAAETQESIVHLQAALARVADGSYGECETCGEAIDEARLQALPEATHCMRCAH